MDGWNKLSADLGALLQGSLHHAVEPFKHFNLDSGLWLLFAIILVALIITWMRRLSWLTMKPVFSGHAVQETAHTFDNVLGLNYKDYIRFKGRDPAVVNTTTPAYRRDLVADQTKYYVVTILDNRKRVPVLYKELRVAPFVGKGTIPEGRVKFDAELLAHVRLHNDYSDDDVDGSEIKGTYDVYIRPVRWYDVRHWLTHPNREIRLVVWVTIITTTIPLVIEFLQSL